MKQAQINIKRPNKITYPIFIGKDILLQIQKLCNLSQYSKVVAITDKVIEKIIFKNRQNFLPKNAGVIVLPFGERAKTIDCAEEIWRELFAMGCDRKSIVVNVGGGVVTDIGGFAASTYMRGIPFINVPTTLLSQVDASVGGKTGINFNDIKNLVGTFSQPKAVVIDTNTLKTLPAREFISGFGEIIKHGLITDKKYFDFVTSKKPLDFTDSEIEKIIETSSKIKASFVEDDEKEGNLRKIVNFGHTIGHALESLSLETNSPLLHGEAVSIGIVVESIIAVLLNLLTSTELQTIVDALENAGLPTSYKQIDSLKVLKKIEGDKKNENGKTNFTLLTKIGNAVVNQKVDVKTIAKALTMGEKI